MGMDDSCSCLFCVMRCDVDALPKKVAVGEVFSSPGPVGAALLAFRDALDEDTSVWNLRRWFRRCSSKGQRECIDSDGEERAVPLHQQACTGDSGMR